jgi:hypothetical protein
LKVRQGDLAAAAEALKMIADEKAPASKRAEYAALFGEVKQPQVVPVLLETLKNSSDDGLKAAILNSLQAYSSQEIATVVLQQYRHMNEDVRTVAQSLLVSRKPWAIALVECVEAGDIAATAIPLDTVRRLTIYKDDRLASLVQKHWGNIEGRPLRTCRDRLNGTRRRWSALAIHIPERSCICRCAASATRCMLKGARLVLT